MVTIHVNLYSAMSRSS